MAAYPIAWERPTVRLAVAGLSAIGYILCLEALLRHGIYSAGGEGGGDVFAYWTAGRHIIEGSSVYGAGVGGYAAFLYPPPFAQFFAALALLPFPVAVWAWRGIEIVCLRVAVGSWRSAGIALLFWPPVIAELDAGNVHLVLAASVALAMRGDARALIPSALTKFASLAALPLAWVADRRGLALGLAIMAGVALVSVMLAPELWRSYAAFLPTIPRQDVGWYNLGEHIPLGLRLGTTAILAVAAVRWSRIAPVAVLLAMPVLWLHSLSVLVAVASPGRRR